jgi:hypothetical protein
MQLRNLVERLEPSYAAANARERLSADFDARGLVAASLATLVFGCFGAGNFISVCAGLPE